MTAEVHKILPGLLPLMVPIENLEHLPGNARKGNVEAVARSLAKFGQHRAVVARQTGVSEDNGFPVGQALVGNHMLKGARSLGWTHIAVVWTDEDEASAKARALADNRSSDLGVYDEEALAEMIADVLESDEALLEAASFSIDDLDEMLTGILADEDRQQAEDAEDAEDSEPSSDDAPAVEKAAEPKRANVSLFDRFLAPPFTVLNARDGWWQDRKRSWIDLGIEGELGRDDKPRTWYVAPPSRSHNPDRPIADLGAAEEKRAASADAAEGDAALLYGDGSTSIFDPVLCELLYRWFVPPGGLVVDPFAGGSVRGIIASKLGRRYIGTDVREVQIEADIRQGNDLLSDGTAVVADVPADNLPDLTPVEYLEGRGIWLKREDLYAFAGVRGAKVRTCVHFIKKAKSSRLGVVTAGSRMSPQVNFVAQIAHRLGVRCRGHVPAGELTPELLAARSAGAKIVQHEYGYNTVITKGAREDAAERGWIEIPYGMESAEAVDYTKPQVSNLPEGVKRIVNACGSGMTLAGILWGLKESGRDIPVVAVCVGHVPEDRLDRWAPEDWREMVEIIDEPSDYHVPATETILDGVLLDAYYEAKCIPHLRGGDCLWVSAIRPSAVPAEAPMPIWITGDGADICELWPEDTEDADSLVTCPPYGNLEVYSDDPRDISTMEYPEFVAAFERIMAAAVTKVKEDRFLCVVVGDFRDEDGFYHGFVADTIKLMERCGTRFYNEAILVTPAASLPIRAGRQFDSTRKLGKTHQSVLVFVKGDPKKATLACGPVVAGEMDDEGAQYGEE